jgi:hypothetical protein
VRRQAGAPTIGTLVAVLLVSAAAPTVARAEPATDDESPLRRGPAIEIDASRCAAIDTDEIERVVALELIAVTEEIRVGPPLYVELACTSAVLTISVADPLTRKRLQRDVPMPLPDEDRERVIALAIAQLFAASWLELLLPPPPEPVTPVRPESGTGRAAVEAGRELADTRLARPERRIEIAVGGSGRGHALESTALGVGAGELDVRGWFGPVGVLGRVGAMGGNARRDIGDVRTFAVLVGLGVAFRVPTRGAWRLGGALVISGGWARLRGVSDDPGVPSASARSPTGAIGFGIGPRVLLGARRRVVLELDAEVGGMLRPPEGLVAGGRTVTFGGVWSGAAFRVAVDLRRRRRSA